MNGVAAARVNNSHGWLRRLSRAMPGLPELVHYSGPNFRNDAIAGLSVAAVALPVGVAYAQLAGFRPEVGLYSSVLPVIAYALFGTSQIGRAHV